MVKKKHEAIVLMEKLHSAETKNQQGRSSEGQIWRGGVVGLNDWMPLRNTGVSFLSVMDLIDDLWEPRNLCTSSPPCKIDIPSTRAATKGRLQDRGWEETRGIVAGEHWEAHGKPEGEQGKRRENL